MHARLAFHGAARTVTGSKYLVTIGSQQTLVDAGLFQGLRALRRLNWEDPPFRPHQLERILLTHTHIDHIGYLPRLVRNGFAGPIYATPATVDLAHLLLVDSARIQEEDAEYANRKGFSRHSPALPLYTVENAKSTLELLERVEYHQWLALGKAVRVRFQGAGHILGSASIQMEIDAGATSRSVVFSGDVGRYGSPLHPDPEPRPDADVLIMESTYGDRDHDPTTVGDQLSEPIRETFARGGTVLIPAFAVGRSQQLALVLLELMRQGRIPEVPIHIDSPMAVDATRIYGRHLNADNVDEELTEDGRQRLFPRAVELHRHVADSKRLNELAGPRIIISASGMLVGGRVLHHLKRLLPKKRNLIVMAGYQAAGTRGRRLLEGEPTLRIHGGDVPVRAECIALHGLSGHGDRTELMRWLDSGAHPPDRTFLTHGEPEASMAFARQIRRELGWETTVPHMGDEVDLLS
jgi:metallo-beta-lactamase family protein